MGLKDGLKSLEVNATTLSGGTIVGDTLTAGASEVGNAELAANAASGTKVTLEFPLAYTGSPIVGNTAILFGSSTTSTGSVGWTVFGKGFAAAPQVLAQTQVGVANANGIQVGSISTGSFHAISQTASETFSWLAIGSGRI